MTESKNSIPVVDVDQVFPFVTSGSRAPTGPQLGGANQSPSVAAVLRDVLGWRPRPSDTKAFTAALAASFTLHEIEGHTESTYVPRGFAMQADLGAVSGGQASLYSRSRSALTQINTLLDGLVPLRPDADEQDCDAFLQLVRHGINSLVDELGNPGGPRQPLIDNAFDMLAGALVGDLAVDRRNALAGVTADSVHGQLGATRNRLGLIDANVNNVDEEKVRTSFWTLVDLVIDLRRSWEEWKAFLAGGSGTGFLGTDLVLISRLMAAAAEQVDELEAVLDSVLVSGSERQTMMLGADGATGLTLDGLLSWLRRFLTHDGPTYARDSGRDGMRTAFAPTARQLLKTLRKNLIDPVGRAHDEQAQVADRGHAVRWIPASCGSKLPPGMHSARVRIAVASLCRLLCDLFTTAANVSRYPGVVLFEAQFQFVGLLSDQKRSVVRVSVRGANLRPSYLPAFVRPDRTLVRPFNDSVTADEDTVVGLFPLQTLDIPELEKLLGSFSGVLVLPAQALPLTILDGETGTVIEAPPTVVWPSLEPPPDELVDFDQVIRRASDGQSDEFDLSDQPRNSSFSSTFLGASAPQRERVHLEDLDLLGGPCGEDVADGGAGGDNNYTKKTDDGTGGGGNG